MYPVYLNTSFGTRIHRAVMIIFTLWLTINLFGCSSSLNNEKVDKNQYSAWISNLMQQFVTDPQFIKICPGTDQPGYYCTGIMIHANENTYADPNWIQPYSSSEDNKLSFSYWTYPILKYNQAAGSYQNFGIAFWPAGELRTDGSAYPENYTCGFPKDGGTGDVLGKKQCGEQIERCQDMGIFTPDDYLKYSNPHCGFAINNPDYDTLQSFSTILDIEKHYIEEEGHSQRFDEFVLKPWSDYDLAKIPLMAFFVNMVTNNNDTDLSKSVNEARELQISFYQKSALFAPIVVITGDSWANPTFSADASYQSPEIPQEVYIFRGTKADYPSFTSSRH